MSIMLKSSEKMGCKKLNLMPKLKELLDDRKNKVPLVKAYK